MPNDTVASLLDDAIKRSGLSNQEVAERLGFEAGNMIELMRQGATQVPVRTLFHVPSVLDLDEKRFFRTFIQDCNGGLFSVQIEPDEILAPRVETIIRLMVYLTSQKDDEEWSKVAEIFDATLDLVRLSSARTEHFSLGGGL